MFRMRMVDLDHLIGHPDIEDDPRGVLAGALEIRFENASPVRTSYRPL